MSAEPDAKRLRPCMGRPELGYVCLLPHGHEGGHLAQLILPGDSVLKSFRPETLPGGDLLTRTPGRSDFD